MQVRKGREETEPEYTSPRPCRTVGAQSRGRSQQPRTFGRREGRDVLSDLLIVAQVRTTAEVFALLTE